MIAKVKNRIVNKLKLIKNAHTVRELINVEYQCIVSDSIQENKLGYSVNNFSFGSIANDLEGRSLRKKN